MRAHQCSCGEGPTPCPNAAGERLCDISRDGIIEPPSPTAETLATIQRAAQDDRARGEHHLRMAAAAFRVGGWSHEEREVRTTLAMISAMKESAA